MSVFKYEKDPDGIVTVTMDMTGPVNAINEEYREAMADTLDKLEKEKDLSGVVFASAKKVFFAGGDLNYLLNMQPEKTEEMFRDTEQTKQQLRRLEKLPVPVVAAINGAALGGGFELCLACNHRVALNHKSVLLGLPEVTLGLMPGAGGIVRMVSMLGLEAALPYLLEGKKFGPGEALSLGLIDELVEDMDSLVPRAKTYLRDVRASDEAATQPWDKKGFKIPGGDAKSPAVAQTITVSPALLRKKTQGLLPGPEEILDCAVSAARVDFDTALRIESRGITRLVMTPQAKNMMTAFFFHMNHVNGGKYRPDGYEKTRVNNLGIVGVDEHALDLACVAASAGTATQVTAGENAGAGCTIDDFEKRLSATVAVSGKDDNEQKALLQCITLVTGADQLQGCDLVVRCEPTAGALDFRATAIVPGTAPGENGIGIHALSSPGKASVMELNDDGEGNGQLLAMTYDFVRQLKKIPILGNPQHGGFSARVFAAQLDEGARLLQEGVHPAVIDNMALAVGMPVGPLALADTLGLDRLRKTLARWRQDGLLSEAFDAGALVDVLETLTGQHNRLGTDKGGGFYDADADGGKTLWEPLLALYFDPDVALDKRDIRDRLLFRPVVETLHCLEKQVLQSVPEANIGALMALKAPTWTGGYVQFVNTYGLQRFSERCESLASRFGTRFDPPGIVREKTKARALF